MIIFYALILYNACQCLFKAGHDNMMQLKLSLLCAYVCQLKKKEFHMIKNLDHLVNSSLKYCFTCLFELFWGGGVLGGLVQCLLIKCILASASSSCNKRTDLGWRKLRVSMRRDRTLGGINSPLPKCATFLIKRMHIASFGEFWSLLLMTFLLVLLWSYIV